MAINEGITLKKLEVFLSFMEFNNLARVADALGQSTVSVHRALHSLEDGLRCPLFKREGRSLIPLHAAYTFAESARRALAECEAGVHKVREMSGINPVRLKIGSLYSLTLHCIPQLIIGLKQRRSGLDIDLTLGSNRELIQSLNDGRLDAIVIGVEDDARHANLISVPLFQDQVHLAAPVGSPYAGAMAVDLQKLRHEKFVTLSEGFVTAQSFNRAFALAGFVPHTAMRVGDIFSLINLVSGGIGYSLLPGRVSAFSTRIEMLPLNEKYGLHQMITLLMLKSRERDPNLLALAAECRMYRQSEKPVSI